MLERNSVPSSSIRVMNCVNIHFSLKGYFKWKLIEIVFVFFWYKSIHKISKKKGTGFLDSWFSYFFFVIVVAAAANWRSSISWNLWPQRPIELVQLYSRTTSYLNCICHCTVERWADGWRRSGVLQVTLQPAA